MSQFYEQTIRLTGMDADGRGICKPSALLDHLQIAAGFAAEEGGFGRETLVEKYGAFWMLARSWFHLDRPPAVGGPADHPHLAPGRQGRHDVPGL